MTSPQQVPEQAIYQLKVTLRDSQPAIWRRLRVPSGITLHRLHLILQAVMGWSNDHLYRFEIGTREYAEPHPDNEFYELPFRNSKRTKLQQVATKKGITFLYEYDFGDSWIHELVVEEILEREPGKPNLACLAGERACPPEDCGGIWGYDHLLEAIRDPADKGHEEMKEWLGDDFDPEHFDLGRINSELKRMRLQR